MRVLLLEGEGIIVPDSAIMAVEALEGDEHRGPWLPALIDEHAPIHPHRRALRLRNAAWVEVPVNMRIVDDVELLELPPLLRPIAESSGIVGLARLADDLVLVCDPNLLPHAAGGSSA